jgi:hypothetical protein
VGRLIALVVALGLVAVVTTPVSGQGRRVILQGRVLWIAGQSMVVQPDGGFTSVRVDLGPVPQSDYQGLGQGGRVIVYGTVGYDQRQVTAVSLRALADFESP